jgi:hypothetical protein
MAQQSQCGLLRRVAPLRKRFAFVAGNDGQDTARSKISFKFPKIYILKPAPKPPVARLNGNAVNQNRQRRC